MQLTISAAKGLLILLSFDYPPIFSEFQITGIVMMDVFLQVLDSSCARLSG
jgi:hypothetical protein